jgi:DNA repair protein RecO (recombination protein O)
MTSTRAIVLSRENFGEADRYVRFFTRDWGMLTVLARSARKSQRRYVGGLDIFCHDEIFLRGTPRRGGSTSPPHKEKPYLVELTVLNSFIGLRENLERMTTAGKITQWVLKLADAATPMPGVYSLLGQSLSVIERESDADRLELLALLFKLKLLAQLGLKPRVEACVRCGQSSSAEAFFDVESGGALCTRCVTSSSLLHRRALPESERIFLNHADEFRLTAWPQLRLPLETIRQLTRLTTQFASFHANTRLPL